MSRKANHKASCCQAHIVSVGRPLPIWDNRERSQSDLSGKFLSYLMNVCLLIFYLYICYKENTKATSTKVNTRSFFILILHYHFLKNWRQSNVKIVNSKLPKTSSVQVANSPLPKMLYLIVSPVSLRNITFKIYLAIEVFQ